MSLELSRRAFLRAAGLGGALAACGGGGGAGPASPSAAPSSPAAADDVLAQVLATAGLGELALDHAVIIAMAELLAEPTRFQFAMATQDREFVTDADVEAWIVGDEGTRLVQGPVAAPYYGEGLGDKGVYVFESLIDRPGIYDVIVATADRQRSGHVAVRAAARADSTIPHIGEPLPSEATATVTDQQGLTQLCTRDPQCSMHEVSLDAALSEGRPVVLTIATPAYCTSEICGPVVDIVEQVRNEVARDDVVWIHSEVFVDPTIEQPVTVPIMGTLSLPSEPWTFLVGSDGKVVDRYDGPVPMELLRESVAQL